MKFIMYNKKERKRKDKKEGSMLDCEANSLIQRHIFFLDLWITSESSFLKVSLHLPNVGSLFLKIHEFLDVQMLQHIIIMIFMAKCTLNTLFIYSPYGV
jgi:hypothetical protein